MTYPADFAAEQIQQDVDANTTHVVAARTGTEKVFKGSRVKGCAIVNVAWLMSCYWSISRKDVTPFLFVPIRLKETDLRDGLRSRRQETKVLLESSDEDTSNEDEDDFLLQEVFAKTAI